MMSKIVFFSSQVCPTPLLDTIHILDNDILQAQTEHENVCNWNTEIQKSSVHILKEYYMKALYNIVFPFS